MATLTATARAVARRVPGAARVRGAPARVRRRTTRHPEVVAARAAWRAGQGDRRLLRWPDAALTSAPGGAVSCNVCGWVGDRFLGAEHGTGPTRSSGADPDDTTVVADAEQSRRHGFSPPFQFITLHLHKP